jgi:hypothetical protein
MVIIDQLFIPFIRGLGSRLLPLHYTTYVRVPLLSMSLLSSFAEFGVPRNISIPSTDVDGTFSITTLQLAAADKFVLTLSDATGFGAGGSTGLLSVGNSLGGSSCDTAYPNKTFDYSFGSLVQCQ